MLQCSRKGEKKFTHEERKIGGGEKKKKKRTLNLKKKNPFSCSRHPLKPRGPPLPLRNRSPLLPLQSSPHFLHTSLSFPVEPPLQGLFRKRENQSSLTRTRALGIIAPTTVSSPAYHHKPRTQHFPLLAFAASRPPLHFEKTRAPLSHDRYPIVSSSTTFSRGAPDFLFLLTQKTNQRPPLPPAKAHFPSAKRKWCFLFAGNGVCHRRRGKRRGDEAITDLPGRWSSYGGA